MDGNIRLTLIILGIGLMVHAGYVYIDCEMQPLIDYYYNECDDKKTQGQYEVVLGIALFLGMMKKPKD